jgi:hypothetical protein
MRACPNKTGFQFVKGGHDFFTESVNCVDDQSVSPEAGRENTYTCFMICFLYLAPHDGNQEFKST